MHGRARFLAFVLATPIALGALGGVPGSPSNAAALGSPLVSDGTSPTLTPQGTYVTLPHGWPTTIVVDREGVDYLVMEDAQLSGMTLTPEAGVDVPAAPESPSASTTSTCGPHKAGYRKANGFNYDKGVQVRITVSGLPYTMTDPCLASNSGVAFWPGVVFPDGHYIQIGYVAFKMDGGTSVRVFCQKKDGTTTLPYSTQTFGNGANLKFLITADTSGNWRTYYAGTDGVVHQFGGTDCTLTGHATTEGQPAQFLGEVNWATLTSTSTTMGPMRFSELAWLDDARRWHYTVSLTTRYEKGTTISSSALACPPYGAGTISSGAWSSGNGQSCSSGTFSYP